MKVWMVAWGACLVFALLYAKIASVTAAAPFGAAALIILAIRGD